MPKELNPALRHLFQGDELIYCSTNLRAKIADFDHKDNVIFIHGFTAHGTYLKTLSSYFGENGFNCFVFNYNSYRGIQKAAETLHALIAGLDKLSLVDLGARGTIEHRRFDLVCHSMGGLVARAFTHRHGACVYVKRIVTLGTPHSGTLGNSFIVSCFLRWGEFVTESVPGFTEKGCLSARQLTGNEDRPALLDRLSENNPNAQSIPVLSISGGRRRLQFGKNPLYNAAMNFRLQRLLNPGDNDGLVSETSSSLSSQLFAGCFSSRRHFREYPEYLEINHSNLVENYDLSLRIMGWLRNGENGLSR
ncbi:alpha/beta fold hydrolase [Burkholderia sp. Ac-20365]|uniref:lipase family alpha/beta hydrolase n=1 Tax=Burkholderia sp. Ac-20365 TaxID=2703897 RepID=UPI00197C1281|nr:alpha/beta fold hydrolase [Burkholderia sp. Ac-20365]MBN3760755.1 alpha/beta fold hydrolase [Burkholderia sp. Ac-20365]